MSLTADRLIMLENSSVIDGDTQKFLKDKLGIDVDALSTKSYQSNKSYEINNKKSKAILIIT